MRIEVFSEATAESNESFITDGVKYLLKNLFPWSQMGWFLKPPTQLRSWCEGPCEPKIHFFKQKLGLSLTMRNSVGPSWCFWSDIFAQKHMPNDDLAPMFLNKFLIKRLGDLLYHTRKRKQVKHHRGTSAETFLSGNFVPLKVLSINFFPLSLTQSNNFCPKTTARETQSFLHD